MKKIAIFTDTYAPDVNGVARTLKRLTTYLEKQGVEYRVFAPESTSQTIFEHQIHRFISLPFFLYPECRLGLPNLPSIKSELQLFKPDLIHIATPFNIGLTGLHYAKKMNIPVVGSYHTNFDQYLNYYELQFLSKVLWKYMHWFHRPFKRIFVPSKETLTDLKKHGFTNLSIWPRGIDCNLFHPNHSREVFLNKYQIKSTYILTYVGRLSPEKDVTTLIEIAMAIPNYLHDQIQWLIVGDGPSKDEMMKTAPPNMTFTGFLNGEELAEVYACSDLFIFPSPTETFGNVVLESLACGTPVIGANSGGVKSIIQHERNGLLCNPNQVDEFVSAILKLINDGHYRKEMGLAGRSYALTQSWDVIFDNLLTEYIEILHTQEDVKYA
ncbi:glycosyltransferase family 4 protein [Litchfieldia salsa]|uniref:Glycosyltransferase involved in cell wall bisynthesis n=1 Tax=Litchfieldia salsa TaxID=930152 RepID=A0A1H0QDZ3_9BACI|nr:glycosyltransferase family 1 protein [Litchfieldia salsa]SDP15420.1 Glycosyltransferase involved in cell wall bisynthesis [Litchfieldia salsa]